MPLGVNHMAKPEETRLELGGGHAPAPGHLNIDIVPEADIYWDLNKGLPFSLTEDVETTTKSYKFPHDSVEGIRCHQVLEHLDTIIPLLNDCYRAMKPGAIMEISTPLAGTTQFWQDPTHKKGFVPESFLYFRENSPYQKEQTEYEITARFKVETEILDGWNLNVKLIK